MPFALALAPMLAMICADRAYADEPADAEELGVNQDLIEDMYSVYGFDRLGINPFGLLYQAAEIQDLPGLSYIEYDAFVFHGSPVAFQLRVSYLALEWTEPDDDPSYFYQSSVDGPGLGAGIRYYYMWFFVGAGFDVFLASWQYEEDDYGEIAANSGEDLAFAATVNLGFMVPIANSFFLAPILHVGAGWVETSDETISSVEAMVSPGVTFGVLL